MVQPAASVRRAGASMNSLQGRYWLRACPGGDLALGQVLPVNHARRGTLRRSCRRLEFGEPDPRGTVWRKLFNDGTLIEYDNQAMAVRVETPGSILAHACGQVIIRSPFIQLDGTVHVTGQLLCSDTITGMKKDLSGPDVLKLLGDPIELNEGGGMFGLAASLITSFGLGAFGEHWVRWRCRRLLLQHRRRLRAPGRHRQPARQQRIAQHSDRHPGRWLKCSGTANVLPGLSNVLGFATPILTGQEFQQILGMANFALDIANDFGLEIPAADRLVAPGAFNGFIAVQDWINGGELNINQLVSTAQNTGLLTADQGHWPARLDTNQRPERQQNANIVDAVGNVTQRNIPNAGSPTS